LISRIISSSFLDGDFLSFCFLFLGALLEALVGKDVPKSNQKLFKTTKENQNTTTHFECKNILLITVADWTF
jgi:hypothetical protein